MRHGFRLSGGAATVTPRIDPIVEPEDCAEFESRTGRVLIMDDEDYILYLARTVLERNGFEVVTAKSTSEAIDLVLVEQYAGRTFDLVLLDLNMPGPLDGEDVFKKIKRVDPDLRVAVSSGNPQDPAMRDYAGHGFIGSIPKPYLMSELVRSVRRLMV